MPRVRGERALLIDAQGGCGPSSDAGGRSDQWCSWEVRGRPPPDGHILMLTLQSLERLPRAPLSPRHRHDPFRVGPFTAYDTPPLPRRKARFLRVPFGARVVHHSAL